MLFQTEFLLGLLLVSLFLSYANLKWELPLLKVINRWGRWILGSCVLAAFATELQWTDRPFWLIALVAFLVWFLLETMYNWLIISALSRSPIPLFPRFQLNQDGDEWPATKQFVLLRDWLKSQGFNKLESIKAVLDETIAIRSSIYQNEENSVRCQILFFPTRASKILVAFILSTQTEDGEMVVTDNVFLPYGGYYPENWFIRRKPLLRSLPQLIKFHKKRLEKWQVKVKQWGTDASLEELNSQQLLLEQTNFQSGFLLPREYQEEHGRITMDGRYRLWKEIWLLNYLGTAMHY